MWNGLAGMQPLKLECQWMTRGCDELVGISKCFGCGEPNAESRMGGSLARWFLWFRDVQCSNVRSFQDRPKIHGGVDEKMEAAHPFLDGIFHDFP